MTEILKAIAPAPSPEDNASAVYAEIFSKREAADLDAWLNQAAGVDAPEPEAAAPAAGGDTSAEDAAIMESLGAAGGAPASPAPLPGAAIDVPDPGAGGTPPAQLHQQGMVPGQGGDGWTVGDVGSAIGQVLKDVGKGAAVEFPKQVLGGVIDAIGEVDQVMQELLPIGGAQLFDDEGNFSPAFIGPEAMAANLKDEEDLFSMIAPADAETVTGGFIRSAAQFLTGFLPATRAVKGLQAVSGLAKAVPIATQMAAGAIADMVVFDPHEDRLSTFLNQVPALDGIIPDYLADNNPENESSWEGRIKNAIEGAGLGLAAEALFRSFKYYKAQRKAQASGKAPDPVGAAQLAVRDELAKANREELLNEVPDEALAPLGDANGSLLIEAKPDETLVQATTRIKEATVRAEQSIANENALAKVNEIREKFAAKTGAADRDPMDDMLDELRSSAVSSAKLPKRPVSTILKGMGGIDPTSSLAAELRARGITAKSFPGLFSTKGKRNVTPQGDFSTPSLRALDNIPASEHKLFSDLGHVGDDGYIPQQAWIDGLEAELKGEPWRDADAQKLFDDIIGPAEDLDESLSRLGIDYDNMSNASVKARLKEIEEEEALFRRGEEAPPLDREITDELDPAALDAPPVADGTIAPGKIYINHARIQSADDVKAVLQQMADLDEAAIDAKRGGKVVTNAKTITASSQEYRDLNDLIGRAPGPMTAPQAVAARRLLASSGEQLVQLAKAAQSPTASPADIYNFRRAMSVHYAIQSEVVAARTETARALQSWAIPAGATKARAQAISDLIMQDGGAGNLQAFAKAVMNVADNPTKINVMARELGRGRFGKALYQVWINGLLSGPKTHLVNILSNSMVAAYAIPERYMAAGISKAFYDGEIQAGEAAAQAFGMMKGIRDGVRLVYHGNKADGISDLSDVFDAFVKTDQMHGNAISAEAFGLKSEGGFGYGIDMLGKLVNVPGNALQAEDKFFKSIGYRMELNALAYRQASQEGLEGKAFAERVVDILNNPPESLKVEAIDTAAYQTFTTPLSGGARQALGGIAKTAYVGTTFKWVVPFVKTPTNIIKYTFARTPLAYMSGTIRADIAAGGARAASAHARVALGTMVMMTVADMAMEGTIVGGGPLNKDVRKQWLDEGNIPYSVKVGGRNYQYSRADPIGMMMGLAADIASVLANVEEEDGNKLVTAGAIALASNLANKTYMSGIFDFIGAIDPNNPSSDMTKYLTDQGTGLIPYSAFLRTIAQGMDPINRDTKTVVYGDDMELDPIASALETMVNSAKKGIPGLSDELAPMRDLWGEDITRASGLGWAIDAVSPIASRADNPDPVDRVIVENRIVQGAAPRQINNVKLTSEEYAEFVREAGRPAKEYLDRLVQSPGFKRMSDGPDGMKAEIIKDVIGNFREAAKAKMLQRHPKLRERSFQRDLKKTQKLTGQ